MRGRYLTKLVRTLLLCLTLLTCLFWFIRSDLFESFDLQTKDFDLTEYYTNFQDNHVYPPPWFSSNWTIIDYFKRKDRMKVIDDQKVGSKKHKIIIKNGFLNEKSKNPDSSYLIVEFTTVFKEPKFCGKTQEFIFGKQCPYHNCK